MKGLKPAPVEGLSSITLLLLTSVPLFGRFFLPGKASYQNEPSRNGTAPAIVFERAAVIPVKDGTSCKSPKFRHSRDGGNDVEDGSGYFCKSLDEKLHSSFDTSARTQWGFPFVLSEICPAFAWQWNRQETGSCFLRGIEGDERETRALFLNQHRKI
jgi:hypothetical protein